jgi:hypothetical protein
MPVEEGSERHRQVDRPPDPRVLFSPSRAPCYKSDATLTPVGTAMNNWISPAGSGLVRSMRRVGGGGEERGATGGQRLTGLEFLCIFKGGLPAIKCGRKLDYGRSSVPTRIQ